MGFKRYIIKRVTTLGSLVKSYKEEVQILKKVT